MSVDLGVFHTRRAHSDEDAGERYLALCGEDDPGAWIEPDPCIDAFYDELTGIFPDDGTAADPWSASPLDRSGGHVIMNMPASKAREIEPVVRELAEKHGLVCFDPQCGKIVTAPPGIHVAETEPTPEELEREKSLGISPFVKFIDSLLKPHGFKKQRRVWRRERKNTITALEIDKEEEQFDIYLCAWLKAKGEIDAKEVRPLGGKWHIQIFQLGDILPDRLAYRLYRAEDWGGDYCDTILDPNYVGEETVREVSPYFEPREPLTMDWRQATLREVIEDHVLPWFDEIEANPRDYYGWGRFRKWLRSRVDGGGG